MLKFDIALLQRCTIIKPPLLPSILYRCFNFYLPFSYNNELIAINFIFYTIARLLPSYKNWLVTSDINNR